MCTRLVWRPSSHTKQRLPPCGNDFRSITRYHKQFICEPMGGQGGPGRVKICLLGECFASAGDGCISNHFLFLPIQKNTARVRAQTRGSRKTKPIYLFVYTLTGPCKGRVWQDSQTRSYAKNHCFYMFLSLFWRRHLSWLRKKIHEVTYSHVRLCWNCLFLCVRRPTNESHEGQGGDRMSWAMFAVAVTQNTTALGPELAANFFPRILHPAGNQCLFVQVCKKWCVSKIVLML